MGVVNQLTTESEKHHLVLAASSSAKSLPFPLCANIFLGLNMFEVQSYSACTTCFVLTLFHQKNMLFLAKPTLVATQNMHQPSSYIN